MTATESNSRKDEAWGIGEASAAVPPIVSSAPERRVPGWAAWVGALVAVLVALGAGYGVGMRSVTDERDAAEAALDKAQTSLGGAKAARADSEAALDEATAHLAACDELVESATAMREVSVGFAADWEEFTGLLDAWSLSAAGSPEEAQAVDGLVESEGQMDNLVGEVTATAAQLSGDLPECRVP